MLISCQSMISKIDSILVINKLEIRRKKKTSIAAIIKIDSPTNHQLVKTLIPSMEKNV